MADEAERPLRSVLQLQARMEVLQGMVKSGLLSESDVEDEVEELKCEAKAWRRRTAGSGGQLALGDTATQLPLPPLLSPPPPPPPALGQTPAATPSGALARAAQPAPPPAALHATPAAAAARLRALDTPKSAGRPTAAPAGSRSIIGFAGFTRDVIIGGVRTGVLPVALNLGRFRCANAPGCPFTSDYQCAATMHSRCCKHGPAVPLGVVVKGASESDDGDESDSYDSSAARAAPQPRARKNRFGEKREDGRKRNRGAKKRHTYTFVEKAEILDDCVQQLRRGATAKDVADSFGIGESMLSKWRRGADAIYTAAADDLRKTLTKKSLKSCVDTARYPVMEMKLIADIRRLRARGRHLSIRWLVTRARAIFGSLLPSTRTRRGCSSPCATGGGASRAAIS